MSLQRTRRRGLLAAVLVALASVAVAGSAVAALQDRSDSRRGKVIVGRDDDAPTDPIIQPPGVAANQSLRKGDQQLGGRGADVLVGRLGPDTQTGGRGDDVIVGGTERGSDVAAFPPSDVAYGGTGDDAFIWAPGDGSDAFVGGEPRGRAGRRDVDTLILGTMLLKPGDNSQPRLFRRRFGRLPRTFVSDRGLPATIGDSPAVPPIKGFCQIVRPPRGLGYDYLVRFFAEATGQQAVTIRVKGVEQVLCGTRNQDGITRTTLGRHGRGPLRVRSTDFTPKRKSKLDALVN